MEMEMVDVVSAEPLEGFTVRLTFSDGATKDVDLGPYLRGPVFEPIRSDPAFFRAMKIENGTVAWDNGADIDPDVLRYDLRPAWMEELEHV
jgi:hypothetical protein